MDFGRVYGLGFTVRVNLKPQPYSTLRLEHGVALSCEIICEVTVRCHIAMWCKMGNDAMCDGGRNVIYHLSVAWAWAGGHSLEAICRRTPVQGNAVQ